MSNHVMSVYVIATDGTTEKEGNAKIALGYFPLEAGELAKMFFAQALAALITMRPGSPWSWHLTMEVESYNEPFPTEEVFKAWLAKNLGHSTIQWTTVPLISLTAKDHQEANDETE